MKTEDRIRKFIVDELHWDGQRLADDTALLETSVLDSMSIFQLISFLESEFGIEVQDEDLVPGHFNTIKNIAQLVDARLAS